MAVEVQKRRKTSSSSNSRINQSINQTSIAPISPVKPGSVAPQPNQKKKEKRKKMMMITTMWMMLRR